MQFKTLLFTVITASAAVNALTIPGGAGLQVMSKHVDLTESGENAAELSGRSPLVGKVVARSSKKDKKGSKDSKNSKSSIFAKASRLKNVVSRIAAWKSKGRSH